MQQQHVTGCASSNYVLHLHWSIQTTSQVRAIMSTDCFFLHCFVIRSRATCGTWWSAVTRLPSFYVEKQHRKKNPKPATNCAQITCKTQKQPHVELHVHVSEVHFNIHNFIFN